MSDTATVRRAPVRIDPVSGYPAIQWNLTPPDQRDHVHICLPEPQQALTLYPMRYGITREPLSRGDFPDMDPSGYEGLEEGWHFGLRSLRPYTYVYLLARVEGEWRIRVWQVTEDGYFNPVSTLDTEEQNSPPWQDIPTLPRVTAALPYITAPLPTPDLAIDDSAWLLVCDSRLTRAKLDALTADTDGLRTELATQIRLTETGPQPHLGPTEALANLPEFSGDPEALAWSESTPLVLPAGQLLSLLTPDISARCGVMQQYPGRVVALHDTTGVMSELGHITGTSILEMNDWAEQEQVSRKVMVSGWIDSIVEMKIGQAEDELRQSDPAYRYAGVMTRSTASAADQAGKKKGQDLLDNIRDSERQDFIGNYKQRQQEFLDRTSQLAAMGYRVHQAIKPRHEALLALYDDNDAENFVCLRRVVAYSISALTCDAQGKEEMDAMLADDGPTGIMERVLMGHPAAASYINSVPLANGLAGWATNQFLTKLEEAISQIPPDDASRYLGMVVGALVSQGNLKRPENFFRSKYAPALSLLDGELAGRKQIPLREAGNWVLQQTMGEGVRGFRPVTVARAANDMIDVYESRSVQNHLASLNEQEYRARFGTHFWHGMKFGVGGFALALSMHNLSNVLGKMGQEDSDLLINTASLGGSLLASSAAGAAIGETGYQYGRAMAQLSGDEAKAMTLKDKMGRWGNRTIGLAAAASFAIAVKEAGLAITSSGRESAAHTMSAGLHVATGAIGGLHLLGRMSNQNTKLGGWATERLTTMASSRSAIAGAAYRIARLGSGTIGLALLAVEAAAAVITHLAEKAADEKKVRHWLARGVWGTSVDEGWFFDKELVPFTPQEEMVAFYNFYQKPYIETDVSVPKTLGSVSMPLWGAVNQMAHGSPLPSDARTVMVALPGWRPQVSAYEIVQHKEWRFTGEEKRVSDPALVQVKDGIGYISYPTSTLGGDIHVKYWPNRVARPDLILEQEKT